MVNNKSIVITSRQSAALTVNAQDIFTIPSYQRPYVWTSDQALQLLDDIIDAYNQKNTHYFIGTVTSSRRNSGGNFNYELIDGQQRITTLMLIALAFGRIHGTYKPDSFLSKFTKYGEKPRLRFAIREQVESFLGFQANIPNTVHPGDSTLGKDVYLRSLWGALKTLTDRLKQFVNAPDGAAALDNLNEFIFQNVCWVNNTLPEGSDLIQQFTTMNTSGIQLTQSDILKSHLLKKITQNRGLYDSIWQACENMNNYFERNLKQALPKAKWSTLANINLQEFDPEHFLSETPDVNSSTTRRKFSDIVNDSSSPAKLISSDTTLSEDDQPVYCRSIISFSVLLIHTLRIYKGHRNRKEDADVERELKEAHLLDWFSIFTQTACEQDVKDFMACLWKTRFQFDQWIVKWTDIGETQDQQLRLTGVSFDKTDASLKRTLREISDLTQLQSVCYFTGSNTQYWLTPLLGALIHNPLADQNHVLSLLKKIDNDLSLTSLTQKETSFKLLKSESSNISSFTKIKADLLEPHGTGFKHYWFQKLEYVLWHYHYQKNMKCFVQEKLDKYRITSKNSIEHVHPQNEEHNKTLPNDWLHKFGNLVLISPGENSSYSNQAVKKKRVDFDAKPRYDALKLAHIFYTMGQNRDEWNDNAIKEHESEMLKLLSEYYT